MPDEKEETRKKCRSRKIITQNQKDPYVPGPGNHPVGWVARATDDRIRACLPAINAINIVDSRFVRKASYLFGD